MRVVGRSFAKMGLVLGHRSRAAVALYEGRRETQIQSQRRLHLMAGLQARRRESVGLSPKWCRMGDLTGYSPPPEGVIVGPELWLPAA